MIYISGAVAVVILFCVQIALVIADYDRLNRLNPNRAV